jgi:lipopolysaccharide/colanic/teichoic acid biosynthesis glycosyltransferase/cellulose synthase/poly-beta-1,6-N-acetylglucosamine synthase-like glycosyltransferase
MIFLKILFWGSITAIIYHHAVYPALLHFIARYIRRKKINIKVQDSVAKPSMTLVMAAYNEAKYIEAKIRNLAALSYFGQPLKIIIGCDGSSDNTAKIAAKTIMDCQSSIHSFELHSFENNRGKVAVINDLIARTNSILVGLTDVTAQIPLDALEKTANYFGCPNVGVVCPGYELSSELHEGEGAYWRYQSRIRIDEATLHSPMGAHGAFYAFRRDVWQELPADTINDDFILPMSIVAKGYRAIYAPEIAIIEREKTQGTQEFLRRIRIGAGNFQQTIRLWRLLDPRQLGLAFTFASGKALRAIMPLILMLAFISNFVLAVMHGHGYVTFFVLQCVGYLLAAASPFLLEAKIGGKIFQKGVAWLAYLLRGYAAGLIGILRPGLSRKSFRNEGIAIESQDGFIHPLTHIGKRTVDIIFGLLATLVLAIIFIPVALIIKWDSKGSILYSQVRVGRRTSRQSDLFYLTKFRTMRTDAESTTGAVWSKGKSDPRITKIGHFLRKTRIDELPQAICVLRGDMSIVGPRPERPAFFPKLEAAIPFYSERTYSIKPGITGLAQVNHGYDESIDDVKMKVLYDHTYAMRIARPIGWLKTDFGIIFKTLKVMASGKGQ